MRNNVCMHSTHHERATIFYPNFVASGKPHRTVIVEGFNPIHRRSEICDRGFVADPKSIIKLPVR